MPIQIRVTVFGLPAGRATRGGAENGGTDLRITAPADTPLAQVLGALAAAAAPGSGTPGAVFCEDERLEPRLARLGRPPLVDGAVLSFHRPAVAPAPDPVGGRLLVVAGPDAGGVHLLRGGGSEVRIGRSAEADVPLDDPDVSRLHCILALGADGSVTVTDLGSTNGTFLGGRPVPSGPVRVPPGAVLRVGESALRVMAEAAPGPPPVPPVPPAPPAPAAPPAEAAPRATGRTTRGLAGWAKRLSMAAESTHVARLPGAADAAARAAAEPAFPARWPDPARLLLLALDAGQPRGSESGPGSGLGSGLWGRDASNPDAFGLRLGTVPQADGRLAPVAVSLPEAGSLGLAGPRRQILGLARAALAQLAALHPPSALELVALAPGGAADWSWLGWLPHLRPAQGQNCLLLTGFDPAQTAARVAELAQRLDLPPSPGPATRRTVVLVDGDAGHGEVREALARLAAEGPARGIHLLCLAETPPATPASPLTETLEQARRSSPAFAACGTVGMLSGAVASAIRLTGPRAAGSVAAGRVATVDAVSQPWAERLARALAPLREEPGTGVDAAPPPAGAPLPASCRLLDALELPRVTPGALRERWAGRAGLPLVFGAGAGGTVAADLADVPGPVLIEGPSASGRTELLCALAASLAAAQAPRELSMLLVEGAGTGLLPCAELPHVALHLTATDPVRMRAFAQAVRAELKRRAALLGEGGFLAARQRPAGQRMPRLVAPRAAGDALPPVLAEGSGPLPWLVVLADDTDALLAPPLGAPGRQAAGSVVRALQAAADEGHRLGVRVIRVAGAPADPAGIRIAMSGRPAGRAELRRGEEPATPFQAARVTGRIPRTSTMRPTVTPLDWARAGDPPARRPVRELGNGPTDVALLASAAGRAAQTERAAAASLV